ncbi:hypothetical protein NSS98_11855 [Paenibacillus sp. FSL E2-0274]|uniref:hypothetical protein n=1 Tax=Paenibacillus TaxID=44249 RepID=UPI0014831A0C|nr:hypothetical protein [Paenibacillus odorifer]
MSLLGVLTMLLSRLLRVPQKLGIYSLDTSQKPLQPQPASVLYLSLAGSFVTPAITSL